MVKIWNRPDNSLVLSFYSNYLYSTKFTVQTAHHNSHSHFSNCLHRRQGGRVPGRLPRQEEGVGAAAAEQQFIIGRRQKKSERSGGGS
jgi:hypothetical protein